MQIAWFLAEKGFHVFPLLPGKKLPAIDDFPNAATRDPEQIRRWWMDPVMEIEQPFNIGISTSRFGDNEALLVVDVDNKGDKKGDDEILRLEMQGFDFPDTWSQTTPTGGRHLIYRCPEAVKQGAGVLGNAIDTRSRGGYIVGPGSEVEAGFYVITSYATPIALAPEWLIKKCGVAPERIAPPPADLHGVNVQAARGRALHYLKDEAPLAREGEGGDQTTYRVAARVKDFGVDAKECLELLAYHWNDRCEPPWEYDVLRQKVNNAYRYGQEPAGAAAPEKQFDPIPEPVAAAPTEAPKDEHPFKKLNREFAFVVAGGGSHILWETRGPKAEYRLEHLAMQAFHQKLAAETMSLGNGQTKPVSELWMRSADRRSYDGICFMPGLKSPPRFYNLWRGFAVEPLDPAVNPSPQAQNALDQFLSHALENVCQNDGKLFAWLMGYFAHLIQRPWEKPLVALVFRGKKGVGKNALVDRIGALLGSHYLLTADRRYLVGNFNGHLENLLLFVLDEAFWSGDKQAEGTLKNLITGKSHVVEHKGKEPYSVENCTRVCILGNEEWLVPASQDERRFAVFNVGDGRHQDRTFFRTMREGMEAGGDRLLLRHLLEFDITKIDVNAAPSTDALMDQKVASLDPFYQWWLDCLEQARIVGADFGSGDWPVEIDKERLRSAFRRYVKERQIRSRIPEDRALGRFFKQCLPSVDARSKRRDGNETISIYKLPPLDRCRAEWSSFIGHAIDWPLDNT